MIDAASIPVTHINWPQARRIIRSIFPPIDLFEDIAEPEDWARLIAAEQKTNPRLMESLGTLDLLPVERRVSGPGATVLMAPFTHISTDRPSRFSDGSFGVFYAAQTFETALLETLYPHGRFMAQTREPPGWTSQFRELVLDVDATLNDLRGGTEAYQPALHRSDYREGQKLAMALRQLSSDGIVYPSQRDARGECAALFFPDRVTNVVQARHLDYHWDGERVDLYRVAGGNEVYRVHYG